MGIFCPRRLIILYLLAIRGSSEEDQRKEKTKQAQQHQRNIVQLFQSLLDRIKGDEDYQARLSSQEWKQQCRRMAIDPQEGLALEVRTDKVPAEDLSAVEPFVGMQLEVFDVDSCNVDAYDPLLNDKLMTTYELMEPLFLHLGSIPKHASDYAYTPALLTDEEGTSNCSVLEVVEPKPPDSQISIKISPSSWWQWWFVFMGSKRKHSESANDYEATGDRAFAAGSHGEVWRGRRTCTAPHQRGCDDSKPLILKRLKVEHGLPLLEAGLREIYFGSVLGRLGRASAGLFTKYVDHFFRQVPGRNTLELWIVYENAGKSLRSYIYEPISMGGFVMYQHSPFWRKLRMTATNRTTTSRNGEWHKPDDDENTSMEVGRDQPQGERKQDKRLAPELGRKVLREVLRQVLESAARLADNGIVHRDIKPSNVLCSTDFDLQDILDSTAPDVDIARIECVLGDFSSAWDTFSGRNLYSNGPTKEEQTQEYSPPEALVGPSWIPFNAAKPESYDSWSIGVLALELLLGTPDVFSVDQRTRVLLTNRMNKQGASQEEIQRALYLAALSQFCIYVPSVTREGESNTWPMRHGDPLFKTSMARESCTIQDFHQALRARDPLGVGFDSTTDPLLHLIWKLLAWNPLDRISSSEALSHPFFTVQINQSNLFTSLLHTVDAFVCPKCGRSFDNWNSCHTHANSRRHAKFCAYDRSRLPLCLNAHSLSPEHSNSGYCAIQGRRRTIEDFHAIELHPDHQFYGVFDGHTGNLAAKYCAFVFYDRLQSRFVNATSEPLNLKADWKEEASGKLNQTFQEIHESFLEVSRSQVMDQSGTTATIMFMNDHVVLIASVGDSRAIVSSRNNGDMSFVQLTGHHVAANKDERELVEQRGGAVVNVGGVHRVNGILVLTRSIGDANLSKYLSRTPSVVAMTRSEMKETCGGDQCFVVLASDGLYDVMSNQEVVDMVNEVLKPFNTTKDILFDKGGAFQEAAERLTQEAYVRGSTDNIGVCVVAV